MGHVLLEIGPVSSSGRVFCAGPAVAMADEIRPSLSSCEGLVDNPGTLIIPSVYFIIELGHNC